MNQYVYVEAKVGKRARPPFWEKGELTGVQLNKISENQCPEDEVISDYDCYLHGSADVAEGTILTFYYAGGEWAGTEFRDFWIFQGKSSEPKKRYGAMSFFIQGAFEILAHGKNERAEGLRDWWQNWVGKNGDQTEEIARWLGDEIRKGVRVPRART